MREKTHNANENDSTAWVAHGTLPQRNYWKESKKQILISTLTDKIENEIAVGNRLAKQNLEAENPTQNFCAIVNKQKKENPDCSPQEKERNKW